MKIKQVWAFAGINGYTIDDPLNEFIETLPQNGREITKITYVMDNRHGSVESAIVEYEGG